MHLNELQRRLINRYQGGFPLRERPFQFIAQQLNSEEDEVMQAIQALLDEGVLSRFGPLYDAVQMGGGLSLAALSVPQQRYTEVTQLVNAMPQVAHNYQREHELNMWFVLATQTAAEIDDVIRQISRVTGLQVYNFPKQQEFYIGLWLQITETGLVHTVPVPQSHQTVFEIAKLDSLDRDIIQQTQAGIAIVADPWIALARSIDCDPELLIQRLQRMLNNGTIRRIGLVPNHYRLGLKANGMTVWDIQDAHAVEIGERIGQLDFVSHCYLRPRHLPVWRYNLFAMVHGSNRDAVFEKIAAIKTHLGDYCSDSDVLFSSAILKKSGIRLAA